MEHFAGIDVSLEQSSVCVVDGNGKIVREAKVAAAEEQWLRLEMLREEIEAAANAGGVDRTSARTGHDT